MRPGFTGTVPYATFVLSGGGCRHSVGSWLVTDVDRDTNALPVGLFPTIEAVGRTDESLSRHYHHVVTYLALQVVAGQEYPFSLVVPTCGLLLPNFKWLGKRERDKWPKL